MNDKRQKNQLPMALAFTGEGRSEAPRAPREGTESYTAKCETESPAGAEQLMEEVCGRENCQQALRRVKANKGSPGIDGMKVSELPGHLKQHWLAIREQLLSGSYQPQPVRRVEIKKPDGGMRKLGIPTVLDRFVQQAVMQVLQGRWDPTFSEHSHGFRPQRSAHQAVSKAQQYIAEGNRWVVDLDLEKVFRSSEPRQADSGDGAAGERQEDAQVDSSLPGVGRDGERTGEFGGGRDSARRAFVTTAVESRARRTRPGVGAT
jgi:RNA-directed DNA polymerase